MKVKSESEVAPLCLTLRDLMDCSLPGSSAHGIFQARVLEWGAIAFSNCPKLGHAIMLSGHPMFFLQWASSQFIFLLNAVTLTCLIAACGNNYRDLAHQRLHLLGT